MWTLIRIGLALGLLAGGVFWPCQAGPFQSGEVWIRQVYIHGGTLTSVAEQRVRRHMRASAQYAKSVFHQVGIRLQVSEPALFASSDSQGLPLPVGMTDADCVALLAWYDREHRSPGVVPVFYVDHRASHPSGVACSEDKAVELGAPTPGVIIDHPSDWALVWQYSADELAHQLGHVLLNRYRYAPFGAENAHLTVASALMCSAGPPVSRKRPAYQAAYDQDDSVNIIDFDWVRDLDSGVRASQVEGLYTGSSLVRKTETLAWGAGVGLGQYTADDPSPTPPSVLSIAYGADASGLAFGVRLSVPVTRAIREIEAGSSVPVTRVESTGATVEVSAWSRRKTESMIEVCLDAVFNGLSATDKPSGFSPVPLLSFSDALTVTLGAIPEVEGPAQTRVYVQRTPSDDMRELAPAEYVVAGATNLVVEKSLLGEGGVLRLRFTVPDLTAPLWFGGDMNNDGAFNLDDILRLAARLGNEPSPFDMTGDGRVSLDDLGKLVRERIRTKLGDTNLDGLVDERDFDIVKTNWMAAGNWPNGDFDGDRLVSETDLAILSANWDGRPKRWQGYPIIRHTEIPVSILPITAARLDWVSVADDRYRFQTSTDLAVWSEDGLPVIGTGGPLARWVQVWTEPARYFRLAATDDSDSRLGVGAVGAAFRASWASVDAQWYQVQAWLPLGSHDESTWVNQGAPVRGDGSLLTAIVPIGLADANRAGCRVLLVP